MGSRELAKIGNINDGVKAKVTNLQIQTICCVAYYLEGNDIL